MTERQDAYWRGRRLKALEKAGDAYCEHVGLSFEFGVHYEGRYYFTAISKTPLYEVEVKSSKNGLRYYMQIAEVSNEAGDSVAGLLRAFANKHTRHGAFDKKEEVSLTEE